jgi:catechol 2,3-dioxygenase-like lactoylglutathione lyase family enzyme
MTAASEQSATTLPSSPLAAEPGQGSRPSPTSHIRIARPSRSFSAAERFWKDGLGLSVIWRSDSAEHVEGGHELLMLGWPGASWHLELVQVHEEDDVDIHPRPTEEDLLVIYLDGLVDPATVDALVGAGGKRVEAPNPYWNTWGVTVEDPDGYRLVLCKRQWSN